MCIYLPLFETDSILAICPLIKSLLNTEARQHQIQQHHRKRAKIVEFILLDFLNTRTQHRPNFRGFYIEPHAYANHIHTNLTRRRRGQKISFSFSPHTRKNKLRSSLILSSRIGFFKESQPSAVHEHINTVKIATRVDMAPRYES